MASYQIRKKTQLTHSLTGLKLNNQKDISIREENTNENITEKLQANKIRDKIFICCYCDNNRYLHSRSFNTRGSTIRYSNKLDQTLSASAGSITIKLVQERLKRDPFGRKFLLYNDDDDDMMEIYIESGCMAQLNTVLRRVLTIKTSANIVCKHLQMFLNVCKRLQTCCPHRTSISTFVYVASMKINVSSCQKQKSSMCSIFYNNVRIIKKVGKTK